MKNITFHKGDYCATCRFEEYTDQECISLIKNSDMHISLTNEDIDELIAMFTELKEK